MDIKKAKMGITRDEVVATVCFALCVWSGWLTADEVFPLVAPVFPAARDVAMLCGACAFAGIALCAYYAPCYLSKRVGAAASAFMLAASCVLVFSGVASAAPLGACAFCVLYSVGFVFPQMLSVAMLAFLASNERRLCCIAVALVVCCIARFAGFEFGAGGDAVARLAVFAALSCLVWKRTGALIDDLRGGAPAANLEAESPKSFLRPMHALFLCIFLVSAISGFGSMVVHGSASGSWFNLANAAVVACAAFAALKKASSEDALFTLVYLGLVAGLLLVPFSELGLTPVAQAAIGACSLCFMLLYWLVISSIGSRNMAALLPTLGIATFAEGVGTMFGAFVGDAAADMSSPALCGLLAAGAAFTFVAFIWLFFKSFSFSQTIAGIEPAAEIRPAVETDGGLDRQCEHVAQRCGLTARESEIFSLLAHGRNTRFIQDKLVISPNTVRTHIKHVYQKLDVHSQQELIDLVSGQRL